MDSINDIMSDKDFAQPDAVVAIKEYILAKFSTSVKVRIANNNLVVSVPNAGLASTLRLDYQELQEVAQTTKKIIIRIG